MGTPMRDDPRQRVLLLGGSAVLVVLLSLAIAALTPAREAPNLHDRASSFFSDAKGVRGAYLVMSELLPSVERWHRPLDLLEPLQWTAEGEAPDLPPGTLLVVQPSEPLSVREADALQQWLGAGGQLIYASDTDWSIRAQPDEENLLEAQSADPASSPVLRSDLLQQLGAPVPTSSQSWREAVGEWAEALLEAGSADDLPLLDQPLEQSSEAPPSWSQQESRRTPSPLLNPDDTPDGSKLWRFALENASLRLQYQGAGIWSHAGEPMLQQGQHVGAFVHAVGAGRVVVIDDPSFFSNAALRDAEADNAGVLAMLVSSWGGPLRFDEYHQGFGERRSFSALLWDFMRTPWGWALAQLMLAGMVYILWTRRRFGPVVHEDELARRDPLELVRARAGLFREAGVNALTLELLCQQLAHRVSMSAGQNLSVEAALERLRRPLQQSGQDERLVELASLYARANKLDRLEEAALEKAGVLLSRLSEEVSRDR